MKTFMYMVLMTVIASNSMENSLLQNDSKQRFPPVMASNGEGNHALQQLYLFQEDRTVYLETRPQNQLKSYAPYQEEIGPNPSARQAISTSYSNIYVQRVPPSPRSHLNSSQHDLHSNNESPLAYILIKGNALKVMPYNIGKTVRREGATDPWVMKSVSFDDDVDNLVNNDFSRWCTSISQLRRSNGAKPKPRRVTERFSYVGFSVDAVFAVNNSLVLSKGRALHDCLTSEERTDTRKKKRASCRGGRNMSCVYTLSPVAGFNTSRINSNPNVINGTKMSSAYKMCCILLRLKFWGVCKACRLPIHHSLWLSHSEIASTAVLVDDVESLNCDRKPDPVTHHNFTIAQVHFALKTLSTQWKKMKMKYLCLNSHDLSIRSCIERISSAASYIHCRCKRVGHSIVHKIMFQKKFEKWRGRYNKQGHMAIISFYVFVNHRNLLIFNLYNINDSYPVDSNQTTNDKATEKIQVRDTGQNNRLKGKLPMSTILTVDLLSILEAVVIMLIVKQVVKRPRRDHITILQAVLSGLQVLMVQAVAQSTVTSFIQPTSVSKDFLVDESITTTININNIHSSKSYLYSSFTESSHVLSSISLSSYRQSLETLEKMGVSRTRSAVPFEYRILTTLPSGSSVTTVTKDISPTSVLSTTATPYSDNTAVLLSTRVSALSDSDTAGSFDNKIRLSSDDLTFTPSRLYSSYNALKTGATGFETLLNSGTSTNLSQTSDKISSSSAASDKSVWGRSHHSVYTGDDISHSISTSYIMTSALGSSTTQISTITEPSSQQHISSSHTQTIISSLIIKSTAHMTTLFSETNAPLKSSSHNTLSHLAANALPTSNRISETMPSVGGRIVLKSQTVESDSSNSQTTTPEITVQRTSNTVSEILSTSSVLLASSISIKKLQARQLSTSSVVSVKSHETRSAPAVPSDNSSASKIPLTSDIGSELLPSPSVVSNILSKSAVDSNAHPPCSTNDLEILLTSTPLRKIPPTFSESSQSVSLTQELVSPILQTSRSFSKILQTLSKEDTDELLKVSTGLKIILSSTKSEHRVSTSNTAAAVSPALNLTSSDVQGPSKKFNVTIKPQPSSSATAINQKSHLLSSEGLHNSVSVLEMQNSMSVNTVTPVSSKEILPTPRTALILKTSDLAQDVLQTLFSLVSNNTSNSTLTSELISLTSFDLGLLSTSSSAFLSTSALASQNHTTQSIKSDRQRTVSLSSDFQPPSATTSMILPTGNVESGVKAKSSISKGLQPVSTNELVVQPTSSAFLTIQPTYSNQSNHHSASSDTSATITESILRKISTINSTPSIAPDMQSNQSIVSDLLRASSSASVVSEIQELTSTASEIQTSFAKASANSQIQSSLIFDVSPTATSVVSVRVPTFKLVSELSPESSTISAIETTLAVVTEFHAITSATPFLSRVPARISTINTESKQLTTSRSPDVKYPTSSMMVKLSTTVKAEHQLTSDLASNLHPVSSTLSSRQLKFNSNRNPPISEIILHRSSTVPDTRTADKLPLETSKSTRSVINQTSVNLQASTLLPKYYEKANVASQSLQVSSMVHSMDKTETSSFKDTVQVSRTLVTEHAEPETTDNSISEVGTPSKRSTANEFELTISTTTQILNASTASPKTIKTSIVSVNMSTHSSENTPMPTSATRNASDVKSAFTAASKQTAAYLSTSSVAFSIQRPFSMLNDYTSITTSVPVWDFPSSSSTVTDQGSMSRKMSNISTKINNATLAPEQVSYTARTSNSVPISKIGLLSSSSATKSVTISVLKSRMDMSALSTALFNSSVSSRVATDSTSSAKVIPGSSVPRSLDTSVQLQSTLESDLKINVASPLSMTVKLKTKPSVVKNGMASFSKVTWSTSSLNVTESSQKDNVETSSEFGTAVLPSFGMIYVPSVAKTDVLPLSTVITSDTSLTKDTYTTLLAGGERTKLVAKNSGKDMSTLRMTTTVPVKHKVTVTRSNESMVNPSSNRTPEITATILAGEKTSVTQSSLGSMPHAFSAMVNGTAFISSMKPVFGSSILSDVEMKDAIQTSVQTSIDSTLVSEAGTSGVESSSKIKSLYHSTEYDTRTLIAPTSIVVSNIDTSKIDTSTVSKLSSDALVLSSSITNASSSVILSTISNISLATDSDMLVSSSNLILPLNSSTLSSSSVVPSFDSSVLSPDTVLATSSTNTTPALNLSIASGARAGESTSNMIPTIALTGMNVANTLLTSPSSLTQTLHRLNGIGNDTETAVIVSPSMTPNFDSSFASDARPLITPARRLGSSSFSVMSISVTPPSRTIPILDSWMLFDVRTTLKLSDINISIDSVSKTLISMPTSILQAHDPSIESDTVAPVMTGQRFSLYSGRIRTLSSSNIKMSPIHSVRVITPSSMMTTNFKSSKTSDSGILPTSLSSMAPSLNSYTVNDDGTPMMFPSSKTSALDFPSSFMINSLDKLLTSRMFTPNSSTTRVMPINVPSTINTATTVTTPSPGIQQFDSQTPLITSDIKTTLASPTAIHTSTSSLESPYGSLFVDETRATGKQSHAIPSLGSTPVEESNTKIKPTSGSSSDIDTSSLVISSVSIVPSTIRNGSAFSMPSVRQRATESSEINDASTFVTPSSIVPLFGAYESLSSTFRTTLIPSAILPTYLSASVTHSSTFVTPYDFLSSSNISDPDVFSTITPTPVYSESSDNNISSMTTKGILTLEHSVSAARSSLMSSTTVPSVVSSAFSVARTANNVTSFEHSKASDRKTVLMDLIRPTILSSSEISGISVSMKNSSITPISESSTSDASTLFSRTVSTTDSITVTSTSQITSSIKPTTWSSEISETSILANSSLTIQPLSLTMLMPSSRTVLPSNSFIVSDSITSVKTSTTVQTANNIKPTLFSSSDSESIVFVTSSRVFDTTVVSSTNTSVTPSSTIPTFDSSDDVNISISATPSSTITSNTVSTLDFSTAANKSASSMPTRIVPTLASILGSNSSSSVIPLRTVSTRDSNAANNISTSVTPSRTVSNLDFSSTVNTNASSTPTSTVPTLASLLDSNGSTYVMPSRTVQTIVSTVDKNIKTSMTPSTTVPIFDSSDVSGRTTVTLSSTVPSLVSTAVSNISKSATQSSTMSSPTVSTLDVSTAVSKSASSTSTRTLPTLASIFGSNESTSGMPSRTLQTVVSTVIRNNKKSMTPSTTIPTLDSSDVSGRTTVTPSSTVPAFHSNASSKISISVSLSSTVPTHDSAVANNISTSVSPSSTPSAFDLTEVSNISSLVMTPSTVPSLVSIAASSISKSATQSSTMPSPTVSTLESTLDFSTAVNESASSTSTRILTLASIFGSNDSISVIPSRTVQIVVSSAVRNIKTSMTPSTTVPIFDLFDASNFRTSVTPSSTVPTFASTVVNNISTSVTPSRTEAAVVSSVVSNINTSLTPSNTVPIFDSSDAINVRISATPSSTVSTFASTVVSNISTTVTPSSTVPTFHSAAASKISISVSLSSTVPTIDTSAANYTGTSMTPSSTSSALDPIESSNISTLKAPPSTEPTLHPTTPIYISTSVTPSGAVQPLDFSAASNIASSTPSSKVLNLVSTVASKVSTSLTPSSAVPTLDFSTAINTSALPTPSGTSPTVVSTPASDGSTLLTLSSTVPTFDFTAASRASALLPRSSMLVSLPTIHSSSSNGTSTSITSHKEPSMGSSAILGTSVLQTQLLVETDEFSSVSSTSTFMTPSSALTNLDYSSVKETSTSSAVPTTDSSADTGTSMLLMDSHIHTTIASSRVTDTSKQVTLSTTVQTMESSSVSDDSKFGTSSGSLPTIITFTYSESLESASASGADTLMALSSLVPKYDFSVASEANIQIALSSTRSTVESSTVNYTRTLITPSSILNEIGALHSVSKTNETVMASVIEPSFGYPKASSSSTLVTPSSTISSLVKESDTLVSSPSTVSTSAIDIDNGTGMLVRHSSTPPNPDSSLIDETSAIVSISSTTLTFMSSIVSETSTKLRPSGTIPAFKSSMVNRTSITLTPSNALPNFNSTTVNGNSAFLTTSSTLGSSSDSGESILVTAPNTKLILTFTSPTVSDASELPDPSSTGPTFETPSVNGSSLMLTPPNAVLTTKSSLDNGTSTTVTPSSTIFYAESSIASGNSLFVTPSKQYIEHTKVNGSNTLNTTSSKTPVLESSTVSDTSSLVTPSSMPPALRSLSASGSRTLVTTQSKILVQTSGSSTVNNNSELATPFSTIESPSVTGTSTILTHSGTVRSNTTVSPTKSISNAESIIVNGTGTILSPSGIIPTFESSLANGISPISTPLSTTPSVESSTANGNSLPVMPSKSTIKYITVNGTSTLGTTFTSALLTTSSRPSGFESALANGTGILVSSSNTIPVLTSEYSSVSVTSTIPSFLSSTTSGTSTVLASSSTSSTFETSAVNKTSALVKSPGSFLVHTSRARDTIDTVTTFGTFHTIFVSSSVNGTGIGLSASSTTPKLASSIMNETSTTVSPSSIIPTFKSSQINETSPFVTSFYTLSNIGPTFVSETSIILMPSSTISTLQSLIASETRTILMPSSTRPAFESSTVHGINTSNSTSSLLRHSSTMMTHESSTASGPSITVTPTRIIPTTDTSSSSNTITSVTSSSKVVSIIDSITFSDHSTLVISSSTVAPYKSFVVTSTDTSTTLSSRIKQTIASSKTSEKSILAIPTTKVPSFVSSKTDDDRTSMTSLISVASFDTSVVGDSSPFVTESALAKPLPSLTPILDFTSRLDSNILVTQSSSVTPISTSSIKSTQASSSVITTIAVSYPGTDSGTSLAPLSSISVLDSSKVNGLGTPLMPTSNVTPKLVFSGILDTTKPMTQSSSMTPPPDSTIFKTLKPSLTHIPDFSRTTKSLTLETPPLPTIESSSNSRISTKTISTSPGIAESTKSKVTVTSSSLVTILTSNQISPSSILTMATSSITTTPGKATNLPLLSIGIQVKADIDIEGAEFKATIMAGLLECYVEGSGRISNRKKRDAHRSPRADTTEVMISNVSRDAEQPTRVDVIFYVLRNGEALPSTDVEVVYATLSKVETSAILTYPVLQEVKALGIASAPPPDQSVFFSPLALVLIGVPTGLVVLAAVVLLLIYYCPIRRQRTNAASKYWKKYRSLSLKKPTLDDLDLMIDMEKGEIVSRGSSPSVPHLPEWSTIIDGEGCHSNTESKRSGDSPVSMDFGNVFIPPFFRRAFSERGPKIPQSDMLARLSMNLASRENFIIGTLNSIATQTSGDYATLVFPETALNRQNSATSDNGIRRKTEIVSLDDSTEQTTELNENSDVILGIKETTSDRRFKGMDSPGSNNESLNSTNIYETPKLGKRRTTAECFSNKIIVEPDRVEISLSRPRTKTTSSQTEKLTPEPLGVVKRRRKRNSKHKHSDESLDHVIFEDIPIRYESSDQQTSGQSSDSVNGVKINSQTVRRKGPEKMQISNSSSAKRRFHGRKTPPSSPADDISSVDRNEREDSQSPKSKYIHKPRIPIEGYCNRIIHKPFYSTLTRGQIPSRYNYSPEEGSDFDTGHCVYLDMTDGVQEDQYYPQNTLPESEMNYPMDSGICRDADLGEDNSMCTDMEFPEELYPYVEAENPALSRIYDEPWTDKKFHFLLQGLKPESFDDGSEYAGDEFESLNFFEHSPVNSEYLPYYPSSNPDTIMNTMASAQSFEHVTKMGRLGSRIGEGILTPDKKVGPKFRQLPTDDAYVEIEPLQETEKFVTKVEEEPVYKLPEKPTTFHVEMKLGRNMRAAPRGGVRASGPLGSKVNQELDSDATDPLLGLDPNSSTNIVVDYFANTHLAGGAPQTRTWASSISARTITSPQHPTQELLETLTRHQHYHGTVDHRMDYRRDYADQRGHQTPAEVGQRSETKQPDIERAQQGRPENRDDIYRKSQEMLDNSFVLTNTGGKSPPMIPREDNLPSTSQVSFSQSIQGSENKSHNDPTNSRNPGIASDDDDIQELIEEKIDESDTERRRISDEFDF